MTQETAAIDTILANEYFTLQYHTKRKIVHHIFHQPTHDEPLRTCFNKGIEVMREKGAQKWLSDDRKNTASSDEENQWIFDDWLPRAVEAGWKYWALVVPDDIYGKLEMFEVVEEFDQKGIRMLMFVDVEAAITWLDTIDKEM